MRKRRVCYSMKMLTSILMNRGDCLKGPIFQRATMALLLSMSSPTVGLHLPEQEIEEEDVLFPEVEEEDFV